MNSFGSELEVLNKDNFEEIFKYVYMSKLRKKIYLFMISNRNENDFFDIEKFNRKYIRDMNKTNDMINNIIKELNNLGWKTHIGFGGTGLYIYSSEELPVGAW
jgi:hypothetical protein